MNKKYIFTALCATSLFGANIGAGQKGTSENPVTPKTNVFKQIQDKNVRQYCKNNPTEEGLCAELANLLATGSQDFDHLVQQIAEKIKADSANIENTATDLKEKISDKSEDLKEKLTE